MVRTLGRSGRLRVRLVLLGAGRRSGLVLAEVVKVSSSGHVRDFVHLSSTEQLGAEHACAGSGYLLHDGIL